MLFFLINVVIKIQGLNFNLGMKIQGLYLNLVMKIKGLYLNPRYKDSWSLFELKNEDPISLLFYPRYEDPGSLS